MVWLYIVAVIILFIIIKELIRIPTVGHYGDRYVFITGCDSGFGKLLALRLDGLGFNVFAACYSGKGEEELRKHASGKLITVPLDVTKLESIDKARGIVVKHLPPTKGLWAVINNAGIVGAMGMSEWMTRKDYEECIAVNLYGVIDVTRVFHPLLRRAKGRVINMSSILGRFAAASSPYTVSKYGVEGFSDRLRREVKHQGITVHILEPGYFKTELLCAEDLRRNYMSTFNKITPELKEYYGHDFAKEETKSFEAVVDKMTNKDISPVVDAYMHAVTSMFPRYRYKVGNDAKYKFTLLWNLPESISDWIMTKNDRVPKGER